MRLTMDRVHFLVESFWLTYILSLLTVSGSDACRAFPEAGAQKPDDPLQQP